MPELPENLKNMWLDAANEPRTLSEPTSPTGKIDTLLENLKTENEALVLVIDEMFSFLNEDVETLTGIKVPKRSTRKHMIQVAKSIANLRPEERPAEHKKAAMYFYKSNPNFDAQRFRKACGISDGMERSDYVKEAKHNSYEDCVQFYMDAKDYSHEEARRQCGHQKTAGNIKEEKTKDTGYDPRAAQAIANTYRERRLKNKKKKKGN